MEIWDEAWADSEKMKDDFRGREIVKQLIRSIGSISANIEEGYGRGYGKEYPQCLRIARGSARESKGWYTKSKFLLDKKTIDQRIQKLDSIISMRNKSINTLMEKSNFVLFKFFRHPSPITHHPSPITHHPSPITRQHKTTP